MKEWESAGERMKEPGAWPWGNNNTAINLAIISSLCQEQREVSEKIAWSVLGWCWAEQHFKLLCWSREGVWGYRTELYFSLQIKVSPRAIAKYSYKARDNPSQRYQCNECLRCIAMCQNEAMFELHKEKKILWSQCSCSGVLTLLHVWTVLIHCTLKKDCWLSIIG